MSKRHPRLMVLTALISGALLAVPAAGQAKTGPAACAQPPSVTVDNSDPNATKVTIKVDCQAQVSFHRIVTATVAGAEIIKLDTSNALGANSQSTTALTLPKAQVCIEDPDAGSKKCIPA